MVGYVSGVKAISGVQKIMRGGKAKLSISQITMLIVNLQDAQKNLSKEQFQSVYSMYLAFTKCNTKMLIGLSEYYETACQIISVFNKLAPYELYSGGNKIETKFLLQEVEKMEAENSDFASGMLKLAVENTLGNTEKPKKKIKTMFVFILVFIIFIAVCLLFVQEHNKSVEFQNQIYELEWEVNRLERLYNTASAARDNAIKTSNSMKEELDFWQNYAVIVTEYGEKYHTYGCQYIEGKTFWIYNIDAAKSKGYEPCSVCFVDNLDAKDDYEKETEYKTGIDWDEVSKQTEEIENELKEKEIGSRSTQ